MKTIFLLMALYDGRPLIPVAEICRDFFSPFTLSAFLQGIESGAIRLPVVRLVPGRTAPVVHLTDLATYIDAQREEADVALKSGRWKEIARPVMAATLPRATPAPTRPPSRALFVRASKAPAMFGVSRATIYRAARDGRLRIHKPSGPDGMSLLEVADVQAWIEGRRT